MDRVAMIEQRLTEALHPESLNIKDESWKHADHAGARDGGGHFIVSIVSEQFNGKNTVQRHRMVYDALGDAMQTEIHALAIKAKGTDDD